MTPAKSPLPFLGAWKTAKCVTSHPDLPHPVSGILTFELQGNAIQYTAESLYSTGQTFNVSALIPLDGSWCPVTGSSLADSLSMQIMGDGAIEVQMQKHGAYVGTNHTTVSKDRNTMTGHWEFDGPSGTIITWTTVSERR